MVAPTPDGDVTIPDRITVVIVEDERDVGPERSGVHVDEPPATGGDERFSRDTLC